MLQSDALPARDYPLSPFSIYCKPLEPSVWSCVGGMPSLRFHLKVDKLGESEATAR